MSLTTMGVRRRQVFALDYNLACAANKVGLLIVKLSFQQFIAFTCLILFCTASMQKAPASNSCGALNHLIHDNMCIKSLSREQRCIRIEQDVMCYQNSVTIKEKKDVNVNVQCVHVPKK